MSTSPRARRPAGGRHCTNCVTLRRERPAQVTILNHGARGVVLSDFRAMAPTVSRIGELYQGPCVGVCSGGGDPVETRGETNTHRRAAPRVRGVCQARALERVL